MINLVSRRNFLKVSGATGSALVLGVALADDANAELLGNAATNPELTPFVRIDASGGITIMSHKPEMGQGTWQAIPLIVAEELGVSLEQITIKQTSGEKKFGGQVAGGSASIRTSYTTLRKAGAAAREMLTTAAAQQWGVAASECYAENGKIWHKPSGKSAGFGELVEIAAKLEVPKDPKLKDPKDFKYIGKETPRPDIPLKVTGKAQFGLDVEVPGMLVASVERAPVFGAKVKAFDDSKAKAIKGVKQVVVAERRWGKNTYFGVAVVAENYWAALQGRKALSVEWDTTGCDLISSDKYAQYLRDLTKSSAGVVHKQTGDFDKAMADAATKVEAFYETPFVSHSPMEPMNATASFKDGKVEVWAPSQGPDSLKRAVAEALGLKEDDVAANITFVGGGFGRRLSNDYACEAAYLAKQIGAPVKVIWTREDDTVGGPFRPGTFSDLKAGFDANGKLTAFQHNVISPSLRATSAPNYDKTKADGSMMEGVSEQAYSIPNLKNSYIFAEIGVPLGPWRAVTSTTTSFAHECFIDELAVAAKQDPLDFRLSLIDQNHDARRVLLALKDKAEWSNPLPKGWGRGVAVWEFFAGLCGQVVEVSKQADGRIKVERVVAVIDLGTVVTPNNVRAQVEGAVVMGLTAAVKDQITFREGRVEQQNFDTNRMLRIDETPPVEVHILAEGGPRMKGVGEPGLPPLAPALANAIHHLTGKRIRKMPFSLEA
jgi:isoquinoline 1-oxidoreductase subunit beta